MQGIVGKYLPQKKFGFIRYSVEPFEVFFHLLEVEGLIELEKGQRVEFELGTFNGKPVAVNVRPLPEPISERSKTIDATVEEITILKHYGVDLSNGARVRSALERIRKIARDGGAF